MSVPAALAHGQVAQGHDVLLVVQWKDPDRDLSRALLDPSGPGVLAWRLRRYGDQLRPLVGRVPGAGRLAHLLVHVLPARDLARTRARRLGSKAQGREVFEYPATWNLLNRLPWKPDILHLHNLHGGYFDLRALPWLTRQIPTVLTLHDAWLFSGHCAHSVGCDRWKTGCGHCPDLTIYPSIEKDATAYNWERKRRIFHRSRFHVTAPARYLINMAEESILKPAMLSSRVIPNGIDVALFSPGNKDHARLQLGLPRDAAILVFVASDFLKNRFKDWPTIRRSAEILADRLAERPVMLVGIGDAADDEAMGNLGIRYAGTVRDQTTLVEWYRAADLCVHAAHADTFPGVVLESLGCGTPVIASAVCGIPEQVRSLTDGYTPCPMYGPDEATGILVGPGDAEAMADACVKLLRDDALRSRLSSNAVRDARARFSNDRMVQAYLSLYEEILGVGPGSART